MQRYGAAATILPQVLHFVELQCSSSGMLPAWGEHDLLSCLSCIPWIITCGLSEAEHAAACSLAPRDKSRWPFPWWDLEWRRRHEKACRWWKQTTEAALPQAWQPFARADKQSVKYVDLRLPVSDSTYPVEWGHDPFPAERGRYSLAFQEWLKRDVAAIWPDVEATADPGTAPSLR
jgi:hypothetical protein